MTKRAFPIADSYYDLECINLTIRNDLARRPAVGYRHGSIAKITWDRADAWASGGRVVADAMESDRINLLAQAIYRERLYDKDYETVADLLNIKDHRRSSPQLFKGLCRRKMAIQSKRLDARKQVVHLWEEVEAIHTVCLRIAADTHARSASA